MKEFRIKFRGVRGSYPVADGEFLKYGGNLKISRHNYQHKNGYNFYGNRILNKRIIDGMNEVHYNMSH